MPDASPPGQTEPADAQWASRRLFAAKPNPDRSGVFPIQPVTDQVR
jgi:hypothetical protein